MRQTVIASVILAFLVAAKGCARESADVSYDIEPSYETESAILASYNESQDREVRSGHAVVDRSGAVLELNNVARVEIPRGTVEASTEVFFSAEEMTFPFEEDPEHEFPVGPVLFLAPELNAPANSHIAVSIPSDYLPYGFDVRNLYLVNRQIEWSDDANSKGTVSTNWTYWRAGLFGDRLIALLNGVHGPQLQFTLVR